MATTGRLPKWSSFVARSPTKTRIFFKIYTHAVFFCKFTDTRTLCLKFTDTRVFLIMIIINGGRCQRFLDSIFWPVIFVDSDFGLFCRDIGLFFADTVLFCKDGHTRHVQKVSICRICRLTFGTIDHLTSGSRHR